MTELHNEMPEFVATADEADSEVRPAQRTASADEMDGTAFVAECNIECDLRAYFPETYVPGAGERMLLYRELDGLADDAQIETFRQRLQDRFGPLVPEAEELLRVAPLRRLGRRCGVERIVLRKRQMTLYFIANDASPFFRTECFSHIFAQITSKTFRKRCSIVNQPGRNYMRVDNVLSVAQAEAILRQLLQENA